MAGSELNALARRLSARSGKELKLKGEKKCNIDIALLCCFCCWGCSFSTIPFEPHAGLDELWASTLLGAAIRGMDPNPYYPDPFVSLSVPQVDLTTPKPSLQIRLQIQISQRGKMPVGLGLIPLSFLL